jgi:protein-S-isoprenylcysteine O-methyltransferase Ste14
MIRLNLLWEQGLRLLAAAAVGIFWWRAYLHWQQNDRQIVLLLFIFTETLTILLLLINHAPEVRDWHPVSVISSLLATFYFLLLDPFGGDTLLPVWMCAFFILFGAFWQIFAKTSLGRSFGLLPAMRSIRTQGAYRYVRHPIYLGYLICDFGFFLAHFNIQNFCVYSGLYALQVIRIIREERLLSQFPVYQQYQFRVRWRLVPGVF